MNGHSSIPKIHQSNVDREDPVLVEGGVLQGANLHANCVSLITVLRKNNDAVEFKIIHSTCPWQQKNIQYSGRGLGVSM
jgi:hypothetical protein